jgi:hypothetical protein
MIAAGSGSAALRGRFELREALLGAWLVPARRLPEGVSKAQTVVSSSAFSTGELQPACILAEKNAALRQRTGTTEENEVAQKVVTLLTDDITGKPIADGEGETIEFAFQGYTYAIDLDVKNAKKFRDAMTYYIDHGRRTGKSNVLPLRRSSERRGSEVDPSQVRVWAEENGYDISPRGRIKSEIVEAYKAAQG